MASYMPQPDSGDTCCDCPDRESPCDDCDAADCAECSLSRCALCFEIKLESGDDFDGDMALITNGTTFIETFITGTGPWDFNVIGPGATDSIAVDPLYGVWHSVKLEFFKVSATQVGINFAVNGSSVSITINTSATNFDTLQIGNIFGGAGGVNRLYRCVKLKGTSEFTFPPDSFDSFVGSASIVDDMLQCIGSGDSYAEKSLATDFDPHCCNDYTIDFIASSSGTVVSGLLCGGGDVDMSASGSGSCPTICTLECSTEFIPCCGETCGGVCGPFTAGVTFRARLVLSGGDYFLHLDVSFQDAGCLTGSTIGGDDRLIDNLGPDPTGTFNYVFDDSNTSTVHYEFTVTIYPPP